MRVFLGAALVVAGELVGEADSLFRTTVALERREEEGGLLRSLGGLLGLVSSLQMRRV